MSVQKWFIICVMFICVLCDDNLNIQKRDEVPTDSTQISLGSLFNNFLSTLFGSSVNSTTTVIPPLNASAAAAVTSFLTNISRTPSPNATNKPTPAAKQSSPESTSTSLSTFSTTTQGSTSWTESVEEKEEDRCYDDVILQNFCPVPSDMTDVSFWDLYSILFSDSVLDALLIGCARGSWCLEGKFDYWEALIAERVDMVMNSEITTTMCLPEVTSCIEETSKKFVNCTMYPQMVFTGAAINLMCRLKQNTELTPECYKYTLTELHVSLADAMRDEENDEEENDDICHSAEARMTQGFICVANSCPSEADTFRSFAPWTWFTNVVDDLIEECSFDPTTCEGHLQVGSSPSTLSSSSSSSFWTPEDSNDVTQMPSYDDSDSDEMQGNPALLNDLDITTMVGVSIATMVTAIMVTMAVCMCYKRQRRTSVIKDGYQKLLNEGDES